jgi:lipid-binding SYLF domain-containing protein
MLEAAIHDETAAALNRLQKKHSNLKNELEKAYGFAVFPTVGRAGVVIGGSYGHGEVFEKGKPVGFAIMSQFTLGVQVGGQTFTQILVFKDQNALDKFKKRGKTGFTANASAVIIKAAATATNNVSSVTAHAYSLGGMLLEATLGGSKFLFVPPLDKMPESSEQKNSQKKKDDEDSNEPVEDRSGRSQEHSEHSHSNPITRQLNKIPFVKNILPDGNKNQSALGKIAQKAGNLISGAEKEIQTNRLLRKDVQGALTWIEELNPEFKKMLDQAYGYAVFPSIGRAGLVLGGAYGKGEVFEQKKLVGYAGLVQVTVGVQVGGETFTVVVLFDNKEGLDRFKKGKISFTANAGVVFVKAGAEATTKYQTDKVYLFSEGGLLLEFAIGGQKFVFRSAVLSKNQPVSERK